MITFMLDTNICVYVIKRKPELVLGRVKNSDVSDIGVSSITPGELEYRAEKSSQPDRSRIALIEFPAPSQTQRRYIIAY